MLLACLLQMIVEAFDVDLYKNSINQSILTTLTFLR
jgi:hypothetical protein